MWSLRNQDADVFDLRQPVGEAAAHVGGHLGDEGIVALVRDRHHGDGRGPARKDQTGPQHPHGDRRAQDGEPRDRSEGDAALTTASAEMKWRNGFSLGATFEGEFSNVTRSYGGKGIVRYVW